VSGAGANLGAKLDGSGAGPPGESKIKMKSTIMKMIKSKMKSKIMIDWSFSMSGSPGSALAGP
jgi:hypothetical protein